MGTPLIGRVGEVAALDRLRAARGAAALLVGEAGIGKTAGVEEAVARAAAAGGTGLTGRGDPREGAPPLWPWVRPPASPVGGFLPAPLSPAPRGEAPPP